MTDVFLAADLGASALRVAAIDVRGRVRAQDSTSLTISEPAPGRAEADPERWWQAFVATLDRTLKRLKRGDVPVALCLTGMTRSQVFLDKDGRVLRAAMLWRDRRATAAADAVARHFPIVNPATSVGAFHPLARLAWLATEEPRHFARVARVLEPKDFLNFRLTGVSAADGVTASRLDGLAPASSDMPETLRRCRALLDQARPMPWTKLGHVTASDTKLKRLRGLPVFAGAMDTWACAIGSGAAVAGRAYDVAGTSEAVGLITGAREAARGLVTLPWAEAAWQLGGATQAGGDAARWAYENLRVGGTFVAAMARAGRIVPADDLPVFLPYLAGERTPVWRADVRGAFHGLSREHGGDAMLWSVLEGVAHAVCDVLDSATQATGEPMNEVRVSGGGGRSDAWCQLKANVLGVNLVRAREIETGLLGCAITGAVGLGLYPTLAAGAEAMSTVDRVFTPEWRHAALFARRAERYRRLKSFALSMADQAGSEPRDLPRSVPKRPARVGA
jgi:xylulokinase